MSTLAVGDSFKIARKAEHYQEFPVPNLEVEIVEEMWHALLQPDRRATLTEPCMWISRTRLFDGIRFNSHGECTGCGKDAA